MSSSFTTTGQTIGVETPEQKVGVGDGNCSAASAVGDRPGAGAGAFGPTCNRPARVIRAMLPPPAPIV
jgi:hypothetical protein